MDECRSRVASDRKHPDTRVHGDDKRSTLYLVLPPLPPLADNTPRLDTHLFPPPPKKINSFPPKQNTSVEVIKSLPGNLWESFGASGWGPDGRHAFMEFDYGTAQWGKDGAAHDNTVQPQEGE